MNVEPNNKPTVIKVGGSTLEDTGTTFQDIATRAKNGEQIVVVHGGGPEASQWLKKMDIESRFENGLRVTDEKVLPVVTAVYAGLINKRLVEALNNEGVQAVGLSGLDGEIITSNINNQALGYVGEPNQVNPKLLRTLFESGYTSAKGQGPWETAIICNEAPSIIDLGLNSFLDTDEGNDWFLDVQYQYYTATITEI